MKHKKQTKKTERKEIDYRRLFVKALEKGMTKAIELAIIAIAIGASMKLMTLTVGGVIIGQLVTKFVKVGLID